MAALATLGAAMKTCFKCGKSKDASEFYRSPKMADGLFGKCKECANRDTRRYYYLKKQEPEWLIQRRERERAIIRKHRQKLSVAVIKRWQRRNPEKTTAHDAAYYALKTGKIQRRTTCEECGAGGKLHKHHDDYSKPLEVRWLCPKCHGKTWRK